MKISLPMIARLGVCLGAMAAWAAAADAQTPPEQVKKSAQRPVAQRPVVNRPAVQQRSVKQTPTVKQAPVRRTVTTTPKISKPVVVSKPKPTIAKPIVRTDPKVGTKVQPITKTNPNLTAKKLPNPTTQPLNANAKPGISGKAVATGVAVGAGAAALIAANNAKTSTPIKQPYVTKLNAPFKSKFVQVPLKIKPVGFIKPAKIVHNPYLLAGVHGQKFGYKPFWYRHGGVRWYRTYYPYLAAGGIWYWYWYNYSSVDAPVVYVDGSDALDCDPDDDDCGE